ADAQAGPRRRVDVDLEADPVIADGEIDDAAQAGEAIHVAHGEDRGALEALQQPADLPAERGADEQHLGRSEILRSPEATDGDRAAVDRLVLERRFEGVAEGSGAEDADDQGRARAGE